VLVEPYKAPMGDEETYNILVFCRVMSHFRDCDSTTDIFIIFGFTWGKLGYYLQIYDPILRTRVFNDNLDIEDSNNLTLPLIDIDIAVHANHFI